MGDLTIPTEPVGSIPRPIELIRAMAGAFKVQVDFTEGRLALKLDPSGALLNSFIDLNNLALGALFRSRAQRCIGVHTCPGGDRDSTHSADVDYAELLPQPVRVAGRQLLRRSRRRSRPGARPGDRFVST